MSVNKQFGKFIVDFVNAIRNENIRWQEENNPKIQQLEKKRKLSQQEIEQEYKRREIAFKYEISQLEIEGDSKIKDFKDYLEAIDQIKDEIRKHFKSITLPVALSVHQYGKKLLISMWNSENIKERGKYEEELFDFLYTVQEDIFLASSPQGDNTNYSLPEKTIKLIRQGRS